MESVSGACGTRLGRSAGRAFAAYGGIYIVAPRGWLWAVEGLRPDRSDVAGACLCLIGAAVIAYGRG